MAALIFSQSISLKSRESAKTLASHLSPGLMAAIMSCMLPIGVVGLYILETFLHASSPLNPLVCSIWRVALDQSPEDIEDPSTQEPTCLSSSAVSIKWYGMLLRWPSW